MFECTPDLRYLTVAAVALFGGYDKGTSLIIQYRSIGVMATEEKTELEATGSGQVYKIGDDEEGVLLYYKFVEILEPEKTKTWLFDLSSSLGLLGRIRVAHDGINVTVGGKMKALHQHINLVGANPLFEGSDFKLASSVRNVTHTVATECGFTSLSARIVKELVTLGLHPSVEPPSLLMAGMHVTAQEFHKILQDFDKVSEIKSWSNSVFGGGSGIPLTNGAGSPAPLSIVSGSAPCDDGTGTRDEASVTILSQELGGTPSPKKIVVVDARNIYETRIGKFCPPKGVQVLHPMVRQYSDLPRWIDDHEDHLRSNQILMYCTGGVRCEMASAYVRSKGKDFEDVSQLSGGIQRYLEAFPDGGYFAGKNFVFDHRLAVPSSNQEVVGSCLLCSSPFDDYSFRCRCSSCRMLVLVCTSCQVTGRQDHGGPKYICELCSEEKKTSTPKIHVTSQQSEASAFGHEPGAPLSGSGDEGHQRKLKILCLHGFRQSASSLKGRLNALRKKLRQHVEFVYVDAPHEVSFQRVWQSSVMDETLTDVERNKNPSPPGSCIDETTEREGRKLSKKFAWLISPGTMAGAATTAPPQTLVGEPVLVSRYNDPGAQPGNAATHMHERMSDKQDFMTKWDDCEGNLGNASETSSLLECMQEHSHATQSHVSGSAAGLSSRTKIPQSLQYRTQTEGWSRSWIHLKHVFLELGPFDGVLGFSQGAAVAAALCTRRSTIINQRDEVVSFRFAILCSGFVPPNVEHERLMSTAAIDCPSLHVFGGSSGHDRQICVHESEELASLFQSDKRMIVQHNMGHIVPTQPEYTQQYSEFLSQFML